MKMCLYAICTFHQLLQKFCETEILTFFEDIEIGLERYSEMGKTFIVGDFNSRTAQIEDILELDKYLDDDTELDDTDIEFF